MASYPIPGFSQGFARNASQSLFPNLWKGLVGLWAPYVGVQGQTLYDWSGFRNDGSLTNMTNDDWTTGRNGRVLNYDAENKGYVDCGTIDLSTKSAVVISIWLNSVDGVNNQIGLSWLHSGPDGLEIDIVSGNIIFVADDGVRVSGDSGKSVVNQWRHAVLVQDSSTNKLLGYVDGELVVDLSSNFNFGTASDNRLHIGHRPDLDNSYFDGRIGSVSTYDRAPLPQEIALLYAIPHAPLILKDDLMAFW